MEEVRCRYVFKKGKNEGKLCTVKKVVEDGYCKVHSKYTGTDPLPVKVLIEEVDPVINVPEVKPEETKPEEPETKEFQSEFKIEIPKDGVPVRVPPSPDREVIWLDNSEPEEKSVVNPELKDPLEMTETERQAIPPEKAQNEVYEIEISRYYSTIPILKELLPPESRGSTPAKVWLEKLRTLGSHMGAELNMQMLFSSICAGIEGYGISKGYKVDGYREIMSKDENTKQLLRLVALKNASKLANIPPEMQLLGVMTMSFMGLHQAKIKMENVGNMQFAQS